MENVFQMYKMNFLFACIWCFSSLNTVLTESEKNYLGTKTHTKNYFYYKDGL